MPHFSFVKGSIRPWKKVYLICTTIFSFIKVRSSKHVPIYDFQVPPARSPVTDFFSLIMPNWVDGGGIYHFPAEVNHDTPKLQFSGVLEGFEKVAVSTQITTL